VIVSDFELAQLAVAASSLQRRLYQRAKLRSQAFYQSLGFRDRQITNAGRISALEKASPAATPRPM
jgi:hypothetical protein